MTNGSLNSYRFSFWLPLFAVLLILIPISIWSGFIMLAKICGISVLVLLLFALRQWFALARTINKRVERIQLSTNDLFLLQQLIPSYKKWSGADQRIFIDQLGLFLAEVQFKGSWEPKAQFSIGAAVILATWGSGYTNKQHWVLCAQDDFFFYREEYPDAKMKLPEFPLVNATMTDVLQSDAILDLKKAIQGIN
jgi:hypothetical protein